MPLDPTLANGFAPLKLDDPMDQMGKVLTNAMMMDKMSDGSTKRRKAKAYNELYAQFTKPDGSVDWDGMEYKAAQTGLGDIIPDIKDDRLKWDKGRAEIGAVEAKTKGDIASTTKTKTESQSKFDENYATTLAGVSNFEQLKSRVIQAYNNEIAHSVYGGVENAKAAAKNDLMEAQAAEAKGPNEFAKWVARRVVGKDSFKHSYQLVGEKDKQTLLATNDYGTPGAALIKTFGPKPERKGVNVNNYMGGNKYRDKFEELQAESDFSGQQQAKEAQNIVAGIKDAHSLVDRAYTGMGAGFKQGANQVANMFGVSDPAGDDARVATQQLNSYLATAMLKNIAALRNEGVKLGSVTEKEFAELQKTTPNGSSDPATIHAWLNKMEASMNRAIEEHRAQLKRASVAPSTGRTISNMGVQPVVVDGDKGGTIGVIVGQNGSPVPAKAIDILRSQPGTRALFEKRFGKAAADQALGGAPTGDRPLSR